MEPAHIVFDYFPTLSDLQKDQFNSLDNIYHEWNTKVNVISRKDIDQLYERHVLHSLAIAKIIEFEAETSILDAGTGGGFPGIPLAILFPDVQFHLVDSIGKKVRIVENVIKELGLSNTTASHSRIKNVHGRYDFIISRAVTKMRIMYGWVGRIVSENAKNKLQNGMLLLKGGDLENEIADLGVDHTIFKISDYFAPNFFYTKKIVYVPIIPSK